MKEKTIYKKCPKCKEKTLLKTIQNETDEEHGYIIANCNNCGYSKTIYDQVEKRKEQLRESKRKERLNKKELGLERFETYISKEQKEIIKSHGLENILKFFSNNFNQIC